jgi:hypothetical protein
MNGVLYNAYVMPDYLGTTKVDLTVIYKGGEGKIVYNGNEMENNVKRNIDVLFKRILDENGNWTGAYNTFFTIYFTSNIASNLDVELIFENSLGNKYSIPLNLKIQ